MEEGFEVEARLEGAEESPRHWLTPAIAVTTATLAVVAALGSLQAGQSAHHSLAELNQAAIFQNQASDQWNFYQAKGIKRHVFEVQRDALRLQAGAGARTLAGRYDTEVTRYTKEQTQIQHDAQALEHRRDEATAVSQLYNARYQQLALSVAFFQIGIVVSSVAAIVRRAPLWYLGLLSGGVGGFFLLQGLFMSVAAPHAGSPAAVLSGQ
jgi:hypothetical protein